jgi:hypothetical protein
MLRAGVEQVFEGVQSLSNASSCRPARPEVAAM